MVNVPGLEGFLVTMDSGKFVCDLSIYLGTLGCLQVRVCRAGMKGVDESLFDVNLSFIVFTRSEQATCHIRDTSEGWLHVGKVELA